MDYSTGPESMDTPARCALLARRFHLVSALSKALARLFSWFKVCLGEQHSSFSLNHRHSDSVTMVKRNLDSRSWQPLAAVDIRFITVYRLKARESLLRATHGRRLRTNPSHGVDIEHRASSVTDGQPIALHPNPG